MSDQLPRSTDARAPDIQSGHLRHAATTRAPRSETEWLQESDRASAPASTPAADPAPAGAARRAAAGLRIHRRRARREGTELHLRLAGAGLAARFSALRGAAARPLGGRARPVVHPPSARRAARPTGSAAVGARGAAPARPSDRSPFLNGSTLYVTDSEGNTVRVKTSAGARSRKTVEIVGQGDPSRGNGARDRKQPTPTGRSSRNRSASARAQRRPRLASSRRGRIGPSTARCRRRHERRTSPFRQRLSDSAERALQYLT